MPLPLDNITTTEEYPQIWVVWDQDNETGDAFEDYLEATKAAEDILIENGDPDATLYILKGYEVVSLKTELQKTRL